MPALHFKYDDSVDRGERIDALLRAPIEPEPVIVKAKAPRKAAAKSAAPAKKKVPAKKAPAKKRAPRKTAE